MKNFFVCAMILFILTSCKTKPADEPVNDVTINTFYSTSYLFEAVMNYNNENRGSNVIISEFMDPSVTVTNAETGTVESVGSVNDDTYEKYYMQLNTKIMSGKAEDIFFFSNNTFPVKKYASMNVFHDLSEFILNSAEFNEDDYYMNAVDAVKAALNGQYALPVFWNFHPLAFNSPLINNTGLFIEDNIRAMTFTEIIDLSKKLIDETTLENAFFFRKGRIENDLIDITNKFIIEKYDEFVDTDNNKVFFNTDKFIKLIETVYELKENYPQMPEDLPYDNVFFPYTQNFAFSIVNLSQANPGAVERPVLVSGKNGKISTNMICFAINGKSNKKEEAWDFIKYMLSEDFQAMHPGLTVGINRNAFEYKIESYYKNAGELYNINYDQDQIKGMFREWASLVNVYSITDINIETIIKEELQLYFTDEKTSHETADSIQRRAEMYLN